MQVIGFTLTKIFAEKKADVKRSAITNDIAFTNFEKDKVPFLKDTETAKISFKYNLNYEDQEKKGASDHGELSFEGKLVLSVNKDELKNITKTWKKKQLPDEMKIPLFNLILKKCTPRAVSLQDEIGLPSHVRIPRLTPKEQN